MAAHNMQVEAWLKDNLKGVAQVKGHLIFQSGGLYHFKAHGPYQAIHDVELTFQLWLNRFAAIGFDRGSIERCASFKVPQRKQTFCFYASIPLATVAEVVGDNAVAGAKAAQTSDPAEPY